MKKVFIFVSLLGLSSNAFALYPSHVYESIGSSVTFSAVNVSTSAATRMDSSVLGARTVFNIQSQDAAILYCGPSSSTTTLRASGYVVGSSATWVTGISDSVNLWCTSTGAAASKAIVIQGY